MRISSKDATDRFKEWKERAIRVNIILALRVKVDRFDAVIVAASRFGRLVVIDERDGKRKCIDLRGAKYSREGDPPLPISVMARLNGGMVTLAELR